MRKTFKKIWELVASTFKHWKADSAPRLGAALAYYGVLALPPILVILLFVVTLFYHSPKASAQVSQQISAMMGQQGGQFLEKLMSNPQTHGKGPIASGIAIVVLIFSATAFFVELQNALDNVWGVEQKSTINWRATITNQVLSFLLLVGVGAMLVISVFATTFLAATQKSFGNSIAGNAILWHAIEFIVSCGIVTALFAMLFKFLPNARVHWRDAWVGALLTAFLFTVGKFLLGLYLAHNSTASAYGVAGSIVLILIWVYYSTQIFLFGAEFTQLYASQHGRRIVPSKQAQWKAEGEAAAEDVEEARTGGKPATSGATHYEAGPAAQYNSRRGKPQKRAQTSPSSAEGDRHLLDDIANRVHSWRPLHSNG